MKKVGALTDILISDAITADNKNVWILSLKKGLILTIERESGHMYPCGIIPNTCDSFIPYRFMFLYENNLYLLPYNESKMIIFDVKKKNFRYIDLKLNMIQYEKYCRFTSYVLIEDIVIITGEFSKVLFFDLRTNEMKWLELKDSIPKDVSIDYWIWQYSYVSDGKLYLVPLMSPHIFIVDIKSAEVNCKKIPDDSCKCFDNPVITGDKLYYFDRNELGGIISEYNIITNELKKHKTSFSANDLSVRANGYVAYSNNALWCFPGIVDKSYRFSGNEIEEIKLIPAIHQDELGNEYPYEFNYRNGTVTKDGHILLVHAWTEHLIDVDTNTGNVTVKKIIDPVEADWSGIYSDEFRDLKNRVIREWKCGMLEAFLHYVSSDK